MEVLTDADGWILIGTLLTPVDQSLMVSWTDRNGKHFGAILNYLRDGTIPLPETRRELMELQVAMSSNLETILISPSVWILPSWYSVSSRHCASGRGQVLLCGRAGAGHRAEPGQIRSGGETRLVLQNLSVSKIDGGFQGVGCGADLQGALDHQPEGGTGLDHSQQYEARREAAHQ